ncbi:hypothetical protein P4C99_20795 [Pontiellaceae bacterium B1224]|nr:hypothetical protein [Pontiellaceae bacterium B1224]
MRKIYDFQHKRIPALLFESDGRFFAELACKSQSELVNIAEESVDSDFAKALEIRYFEGNNAYAITFQEPENLAECYHALLVKTDDGFLYYTLEKGLDLFGHRTPSMLCGWTPAGTHLNYGSQRYTDLQSFVDDVSNRLIV